MTKNKKLGVLLIILPPLLLVGALSAYAIVSFVSMNLSVAATPTSGLSPSGLASTDLRTTVSSILRVGLGLLGLVGVLGMLISVPFGIYFLNKKNPDEEAKELEVLQSNEKYKNLTPEQINFIRQWSWGAFFGQLVWPFGNKLYLWALAAFVPFFNIYAWLKLSISGRQMAWEKGGWKDFEQFKKRQTIMARIILAVFILSVLSELF